MCTRYVMVSMKFKCTTLDIITIQKFYIITFFDIHCHPIINHFLMASYIIQTCTIELLEYNIIHFVSELSHLPQLRHNYAIMSVKM